MYYLIQNLVPNLDIKKSSNQGIEKMLKQEVMFRAGLKPNQLVNKNKFSMFMNEINREFYTGHISAIKYTTPQDKN